MANDEMTTAESWDRLWTAGPGGRTGLRSRLRTQTSWRELLAHLLATPSGAADVIELGCAPGSMIEQMHSIRPDHQYRGIDIAEQGLEVARQRLVAAGIEADLEVGDIRDAVIPPADLVVSFGLAEHFTDPAEAVRYHVRFAKPGGHVAITVPNYSHRAVVRAMRWFSPETLATHNLTIMSPDAMRQAMTAAGLVDVQTGRRGGAILPNSRPRPGPVGKAYRFAARAWNVSTTILPEGHLWSANVWGVGRAT